MDAAQEATGRRPLSGDGAAWTAVLGDAEPNEEPTKPEDYAIVDNAFRMVRPYWFDFACSVRQRWAGQGIIDLFCKEFPARSREYYMQAVADGRLRVEGVKNLTPDMPLQAGARIRHFLHRHEPPAPCTSVRVVGSTEDLVAVCKPHGMPVHVAGQYRKNTVLGVLGAEHPELLPLLPCHRLDKPVSGLLLFARHAAAADALRRRIEEHSVEKVYVARVQGVFPATGANGQAVVVADTALGWDPAANSAFAVPSTATEAAPLAVTLAEADGRGGASSAASKESGPATATDGIKVPPACENGAAAGDDREAEWAAAAEATAAEEPGGKRKRRKKDKPSKQERIAAFKAATTAAAHRQRRTEGKPAVTHFRLLGVAADGLTSVVECNPLTGRTHQIRVHLAGLGHPVANDGQYGGRYGGPVPSRALAQQLGVSWAEARAGASRDEQLAGTGTNSNAAQAARDGDTTFGSAPAASGCERIDADAAQEGDAAAMFRWRPEFQAPAELHDPHCPHCPYFAPRDYPTDLRPLWLHARTYSCSEWGFTAEPPEWAGLEWAPPVLPDATT